MSNAFEAHENQIITKNSLLELSNALLKADSSKGFRHTVLPIIKRLLHVNGLLMFSVKDLNILDKPLVAVFDGDHLAGTAEFQANDPVRDNFRAEIIKQIMSAAQPLSWLMSDLMKMEDRPTFLTRYRINQVKKVIAVPYHDQENSQGVLFFFSADSHPATTYELDLCAMVTAQLAPGILQLQKLEEQRDQISISSFCNKVTGAKSVANLQHLLVSEFEKFDYIQEACLLIRKNDHEKLLPLIIKRSVDSVFARDAETLDALSVKALPLNLTLTHHAETLRFSGLAAQNGMQYLLTNWFKYPDLHLLTKPLVSEGTAAGVLLYFAKPNTDPEKFNGFWDGAGPHIALMVNHIAFKDRQKELLSELDVLKRQLGLEQQANRNEEQDFRNYIIGKSERMREVFNLITKVAATDSSVLILGETGTGKELLARAIHQSSLRKDQPFIKVNCATLPPNLIESELFGHERGSFTGAFEKKIGKFELANNGTIFLDEIGELPLNLQTKLLRALQEKEIERIGGKQTIKVDIRIISATNRDLFKISQQGFFRTDLYFRLNVFPVQLPTLKDRKEDIPLLVNHFAVKYSKRNSLAKFFSSKAMKQLMAYNWPGNIRELEHLVQRSVILSKGKVITQVYLPATNENEHGRLLSNSDVKTIEEVERDHILSVLKMVNGKVSGVGGAAEILKIPATTLSSKIIKLKIKKGFVDSDNS